MPTRVQCGFPGTAWTTTARARPLREERWGCQKRAPPDAPPDAPPPPFSVAHEYDATNLTPGGEMVDPSCSGRGRRFLLRLVDLTHDGLERAPAGCGRDGAGPKRPERHRQSGFPAGPCPEAAGELGPSNGALTGPSLMYSQQRGGVRKRREGIRPGQTVKGTTRLPEKGQSASTSPICYRQVGTSRSTRCACTSVALPPSRRSGRRSWWESGTRCSRPPRRSAFQWLSNASRMLSDSPTQLPAQLPLDGTAR